MSDRPDPLAPPEGYGARPAGQAPDLSQCATATSRNGEHCPQPVTEIWTIGCTVGEHAGKISYCDACGAIAVVSRRTCGQCRTAGHPDVPVKVYARTTAAGEPLPLPQDLAGMDAQKAIEAALRGAL